MTYISAFECLGGIVMCADTQETHEAGGGRKEEMEYVEKLYAPEKMSFPIAVGGAGIEEPIEAFSLELFERVEKNPPATIADLRSVIQASITEVHSSDVKLSAWPAMYRTTKCIVAAKPTNDDFAIFVTTGKRVSFRKREPVIIGYDTPANMALLKRMYRPGLPMQQAVMLAIYLLTQSKARDVGVGGDPRIVIVRDNGAWIDDPEYVKRFEGFIGEFLALIDPLFLNCVDVSIPPESGFPDKLAQFGEAVTRLREKSLNYSAQRSLWRAFSDPNFKGDAYSKIFPGGIATFNEDVSKVTVREESAEEREAIANLYKAFAEVPQDAAKIAQLMEARRKLVEKYQKPGQNLALRVNPKEN